MQIVRSVRQGKEGALYAQFLHRRVSIRKLKEMLEVLDAGIIERILSFVENRDYVDSEYCKTIQDVFFPHVEDNLKSSLVVLSLSATHSYYSGAYVKRRGFKKACKAEYASAIINSAKSIAKLSSKAETAEELFI